MLVVFPGSSFALVFRRIVAASSSVAVFTLLLQLLLISNADAILPRLALDVRLGETSVSTMFLSHALFGPQPRMLHQDNNNNNKEEAAVVPLTLTYPPDEANALLCQTVTTTTTTTTTSSSEQKLPNNSLILVPRGGCTFETKALNAERLGASAIIIYGSLASRYTLNTTNANATGDPDHYTYTTNDIVYPIDKMDYDCDYGQAWIPASAVTMDDPLPYNAAVNDLVLSGSESNLCLANAIQPHRPCASNACLLTGNTTSRDGAGLLRQACCAWDLHIWLYPDPTLTTTSTTGPGGDAPSAVAVTIPAAYMTAGQASELMQVVARYESLFPGEYSTSVTVVMYNRWRPAYNVSAVLIWLLGSVVATLAAYLSASDYRSVTTKVLQKRERRHHHHNVRQGPSSASSSSSSSVQQQQQQHQNNSNNNNNSDAESLQQRQPLERQQSQEEVLELTAAHAAGFVVMASTSLLVLFYFQIYGIVKVFYAFGCSTAVSQVILYPLYNAIMMSDKRHRDVVVWRTGTEDFGDITVRDIVTHAVGFSLGLTWLYLAFAVRDPESITFFWVMQDVFGSCMCITFLKAIRLNNIRVASILLVVAFFYDIFFVFVTPYLFHGQSVMITVATSGGPPKADASWCEKYPNDRDCQGGNPLPMLLAVPRLLDYMGGSSLLGLGDIVLPGLLLSFAARLDAAKTLLGVMGGGRGASNQSYNCPEQQWCCGSGTTSSCAPTAVLCRGGYFAPLVLAYAVGLAMANTAVYVMNMGQPALLYLVPCCLGTMVYIGWRRKELPQLWDGPRVLRTADEVVFGQPQSQLSPGQHEPLPVEEEESDDPDNVLVRPPPSAADDVDDNRGERLLFHSLSNSSSGENP